ncbi:MAG: hypothetical protein SGCHY_003997 [Lobulomycetales sp.]
MQRPKSCTHRKRGFKAPSREKLPLMNSKTLLTAFALVGTVLGQNLVTEGSGRVTFYGEATDEAGGVYNPFNPKQYGACGPKKANAPNGAEQYFAAMDSVEFNKKSPGGNSYKNSYCGKCMQVTNPGNGNSVVVYLTDSCVGCGNGNIDISLAAMSDLVGGVKTAYSLGILQNAPWKHVSCPATLGKSQAENSHGDAARPQAGNNQGATLAAEIDNANDPASQQAGRSQGAAPAAEKYNVYAPKPSYKNNVEGQATKYKCRNRDLASPNTTEPVETSAPTGDESGDIQDEPAGVQSGSMRVALSSFLVAFVFLVV